MKVVDNDWDAILATVYESPDFTTLQELVKAEYATKTVYPPQEKLFQAFRYTPFKEVKVVILGQDPYHGPNQANGMSFSVSDATAKFPPSLRNIFKEIKNDVGVIRQDTDLSDWAKQGVLLLNTVLTVEHSKAASHRGIGWEAFTDIVITKLNDKSEQVIFVLWGNDAKKKLALITNPVHKIITGVHPSPLSASRGFFGSKPFSKINEYLITINEEPIIW